MAWRLAQSLDDLRNQVNAAAPKRSKKSDGTIGDTAHSHRKSDHNPDSSGIVRALDITHDPANGIDARKIANDILASRDKRLKYVISNGEIASGELGPSPWKWRKYSGSNPHTKHVHVSVRSGNIGDRGGQWGVTFGQPDPNADAVKDWPTLRRGDKGHSVMLLQQALKIDADGDFGPKTEKAVKAFQKSSNLVADGIVGPYTWGALLD